MSSLKIPRYTNLSQNSICFDEFFNKMVLDVNPCYDNNYVYRLDNHVYRLNFLDNKNGGTSFNFDNFIPNKPELEKKINAKYMIYVLVNHNLLCFCNLIIIVVMDAYVITSFVNPDHVNILKLVIKISLALDFKLSAFREATHF